MILASHLRHLELPALSVQCDSMGGFRRRRWQDRSVFKLITRPTTHLEGVAEHSSFGSSSGVCAGLQSAIRVNMNSPAIACM
jgi:hypothetical protein